MRNMSWVHVWLSMCVCVCVWRKERRVKPDRKYKKQKKRNFNNQERISTKIFQKNLNSSCSLKYLSLITFLFLYWRIRQNNTAVCYMFTHTYSSMPLSCYKLQLCAAIFSSFLFISNFMLFSLYRCLSSSAEELAALVACGFRQISVKFSCRLPLKVEEGCMFVIFCHRTAYWRIIEWWNWQKM